jgi:hypothetical protein
VATKTQASTIEVTFFPTQAAQSMRVRSMTLAELRKLIETTTAASKKRLPWLKIATFGTERSEKNCLRFNANVRSINGIELDYDAGEMSFDEAVGIAKKAKLAALFYTSASHTAEKPRWRIVLPTSRPLPPEARAKLVARVNGLFGGVFSPESFTLSQSYYFGSVGNNPNHRAVVTDGDCIDLREDLDAGAIGRSGAGVAEEKKNFFVQYGLSVNRPSLKKIADALDAIPNTEDVDRKMWIDIGHAIKSAYPDEDGLRLFVQWSMTWTGGESDVEYTIEKWRSFRPTKISIGTLFWYAEMATPGWRGAKSVTISDEKLETRGEALETLCDHAARDIDSD